MIDVYKAREELAAKSKQQIEAETAETWAARAIAAYERFGAPQVLGTHQRLKLFAEAVEYEHEALEHASSGRNLAEVARAINDAKLRLGLSVAGY